jgi:hypothetical protein
MRRSGPRHARLLPQVGRHGILPRSCNRCGAWQNNFVCRLSDRGRNGRSGKAGEVFIDIVAVDLLQPDSNGVCVDSVAPSNEAKQRFECLLRGRCLVQSSPQLRNQSRGGDGAFGIDPGVLQSDHDELQRIVSAVQLVQSVDLHPVSLTLDCFHFEFPAVR